MYILSEEELGGKKIIFKKLKRLCTARSTRLFSQVVLYVIELGQGMEIKLKQTNYCSA